MSRTGILITIIVLFNLVVFYGRYLKEQETVKGEPMAAMTVPDFHWTDFDGKRHDIKELTGHTVIIHFWATWCGPCRQEFPELLQASKSVGNNVIFLTISGDETKLIAQKFIAHAQEATGTKDATNVLYAFDPNKTISFDTFQTDVYPESIVVDPKQNMQRKFAGTVNWNNPDVVKSIESYGH